MMDTCMCAYVRSVWNVLAHKRAVVPECIDACVHVGACMPACAHVCVRGMPQMLACERNGSI